MGTVAIVVKPHTYAPSHARKKRENSMHFNEFHIKNAVNLRGYHTKAALIIGDVAL